MGRIGRMARAGRIARAGRMTQTERALGRLLLLTAAAHLAVGAVGLRAPLAALLRGPSGFWALLPQGLLARRAGRTAEGAR